MAYGRKSVRGIPSRRSPGWLHHLRGEIDAQIPCGYQDETGFHLIIGPTYGPPSSPMELEPHPELIGGLSLSHLDFAELLGRKGRRLAGFLIHHQNLFRSDRNGIRVEKID